ncbi:hypothetical protein ZIOFF_031872 [Zingiber officinale]|uniref:Plant bHLH transcription factor ACT-like domain-containing protein n=1 Tax=Zingiber officinale TaxID=94328 RepID=A0A8J5GUN0_ZINOF|nr:hypothetical protein ZIOFF_031872 [Zingiber officinale]
MDYFFQELDALNIECSLNVPSAKLFSFRWQLNKTSILQDASKYIEELKKKVDMLNQEIECTQSSIRDKALPDVTVETLQRGFLINVSSMMSYPGLLVSILEAFDQLGLSVVQARAACTDTFHLEVVGGDIRVETMDAHVVKQAVLHAIKVCSGSIED